MPAGTRRFSLGRKACAAGGAASALLGLLLMPLMGSRAEAQVASSSPTPTASATTSSPTPTASPSPSPSRSPRPKPSPKPSHSSPPRKPTAPPGGVVVRGPNMWDPAASKKFSHPSYVTVSAVGALTNEVVEITWTGFTPSSEVAYDPDGTDYPVMVAECTGTHPTKWSQCFGANNGGVQGSFSAYGPMNTAYATTDAAGDGSTPIQLETAQENSALGCDLNSPCSLVIVPAQGGNVFDDPVDCNDHSEDTGLTDTGAFAFNSTYGTCSWRDRIIVPLQFAQTSTDCPVRNPDFSVIGSAMLARAMASWQAALCSISDPISIQYDGSEGEPLAREDFQSGLDDVALTTLPASGTSAHPYTYAPVAISAESFVFWIDNATTGQPRTHLKLDPRLMLKLLTQSYDFEGEACSGGAVRHSGSICDNAVDNNPESLFADPEFIQLNGHIPLVGDGYQIPTVLSGESDMTWELTRWIAANPAAKAFADGNFDPWGEHINTDYLDMQLPINSLNSMDPFGPIAHRYDPVFPLSAVAQYQVDNWYPATNWQPDPQGNYDKLSPEVPGQRALFAILDEADAAAYQLPTAALQNADGQYVAPSDASMTAALSAMTTDRANHITQDINEKSKVSGAYPLTMIIYAMVPTGGISKTKAAKIAQWLDFVADEGQTPGTNAGELPPGYLPLTTAMRAQTLKAAQEVLDQSGGSAKKTGTSATSPSPAAAATTKSRTPASVSLGYVTNPGTSGLTRYAVPLLLIAGGLLAVAGSLSFAVGRGSGVLIARLRKVRLPWPAMGERNKQ